MRIRRQVQEFRVIVNSGKNNLDSTRLMALVLAIAVYQVEGNARS
jgi:hypothetical protein